MGPVAGAAGGFAAAVSSHPVTAHAVGEVVGEVLERLGTHPDLAVVFVTGGHAGALEDVGRAVRALLSPTVLLGAASNAVIGPHGDDLDPGPGIALWTGLVGPVAPMLLDGTGAWGGGLPSPGFPAGVAVLLGDPSGPGLATATGAVAAHGPEGLPAAGGITTRPGLLVQDRVIHGAVVGALVGRAIRARVVVSEGGRPVGDPLTVTRAERSVVYELDGRPALERLLQVVADRMPAGDVHLVTSGLRLAVVDGAPGEGAPGSRAPLATTLVVRGADRSNGALGLTGSVPTGATVRFEVRDPRVATDALQRALGDIGDDTAASAAANGAASTGVLLFRAAQRDAAWFGRHPPDATVVAETLPLAALAGCATAGQFGPRLDGQAAGSERAAAVIFDDGGRSGATGWDGDPTG